MHEPNVLSRQQQRFVVFCFWVHMWVQIFFKKKKSLARHDPFRCKPQAHLKAEGRSLSPKPALFDKRHIHKNTQEKKKNSIKC